MCCCECMRPHDFVQSSQTAVGFISDCQSQSAVYVSPSSHPDFIMRLLVSTHWRQVQHHALPSSKAFYTNSQTSSVIIGGIIVFVSLVPAAAVPAPAPAPAVAAPAPALPPTRLSFQLFQHFQITPLAQASRSLVTTRTRHSDANILATALRFLSIRLSVERHHLWIMVAARARLEAERRREARKERDTRVKSRSKNLPVRWAWAWCGDRAKRCAVVSKEI